MNLASVILLLIILGAVGLALWKMLKSKGACEDCKVACPAHSTIKTADKLTK